jgi:hypothetical protein
MFDFRYHVVSLSAVFLALVIGILVGAGISGRGLLDEAERDRLNADIAEARAERDAAELQLSEHEAAEELARAAYPALVANRLDGKHVAVVFVGSIDPGVREFVERTVEDAGGSVVRLLAITVPAPIEEIEAALTSRRPLQGYMGEDRLDDLGRDLGSELVDGGSETPLWDALAGALVEERAVDRDEPADAVVVCRTALPQRAQTARFLRGFYSGIASAAPAAVGVEASTAPISAVPAYRRSGLSSVDAVDRPVGWITLAVLLAGGRPGHYGIKEERTPAVPEIEPVAPPPPAGS